MPNELLKVKEYTSSFWDHIENSNDFYPKISLLASGNSLISVFISFGLIWQALMCKASVGFQYLQMERKGRCRKIFPPRWSNWVTWNEPHKLVGQCVNMGDSPEPWWQVVLAQLWTRLGFLLQRPDKTVHTVEMIVTVIPQSNRKIQG